MKQPKELIKEAEQQKEALKEINRNLSPSSFVCVFDLLPDNVIIAFPKCKEFELEVMLKREVERNYIHKSLILSPDKWIEKQKVKQELIASNMPNNCLIRLIWRLKL